MENVTIKIRNVVAYTALYIAYTGNTLVRRPSYIIIPQTRVKSCEHAS